MTVNLPEENAMNITEIATPEIRNMVGNTAPPHEAVDEVTTSEIRRWVTATLDDNPLWYDKEYAEQTRFGTGNAPGPFPMRAVGHWKRKLGTPDPVRLLNENDDFRYGNEELDDPSVRINWPQGVGSFHAGNEVEYFKLPKVGDQISVVISIVSIEEKQGRSGPLVIVHLDQTFTNQDGDVLIVNHATNIARKMPGESWQKESGTEGPK
jgi:acyl dehydratase